MAEDVAANTQANTASRSSSDEPVDIEVLAQTLSMIETLPTTLTPSRPEGWARNGRRVERYSVTSEPTRSIMAEDVAAKAQANTFSCSSADEPAAIEVPQIWSTMEALPSTLMPSRPEGLARNGRKVDRYRFSSEPTRSIMAEDVAATAQTNKASCSSSDEPVAVEVLQTASTLEALASTSKPSRPEGRARNVQRVDQHRFSSEPTRSTGAVHEDERLQETKQNSKAYTRLWMGVTNARVDQHRRYASQQLNCMDDQESVHEDEDSASDQMTDTEDEHE